MEWDIATVATAVVFLGVATGLEVRHQRRKDNDWSRDENEGGVSDGAGLLNEDQTGDRK